MKIIEVLKQWLAEQHMTWFDKLTIGGVAVSFVNWMPHAITFLILVWWGLRVWIVVRDEILRKKKVDKED